MSQLFGERADSGIGARFLLTAACLIIVIGGLRYAETVVVTFLLALFLAMVGIPPLRWLQSKRVPAGLAVLIVMIGILAIFAGAGALVGTSLNDFTRALPGYRNSLVGQFQEWYDPIQQFLQSWGFEFSFEFPTSLLQTLLQMAGGTLTRLASIVTDLVFVFLTTVFILAEATDFPKKLQAALQTVSRQQVELKRFEQIMSQVRDYLVIKTGISILTGILVGIWVWAWGVDFPFLWGLVAFVLNYIPNLGSIIAAFPPVVLALIQPGEGGLSLAVAVIIGYLAVNMVVGNFIEPRLMGRKLGLSTLVVFLSLGFWGWVWGGVGMLLSVPLTMIVKILLQNSDDLRWIAILLGSVEEATAKTEK